MSNYEKVKSHFHKLSSCYFQLDEVAKGNAFKSAWEKLAEEFNEFTFPSSVKQIPKLRGVGESSLNEISEVLEKGTSDRLLHLESQLSDTSAVDVKSKLKSLGIGVGSK